MHRYFNDILKQVDENYVEKKVSVKQKPSIEIELVEDLELEFPEEVEREQVQNLFDGYLGEQKEVPNPLEYGPNATYRNLREGVVYKKGPDNLWEMFVKDGQNGKQGAAGGSGTGVNEVKQIIVNETGITKDSNGNLKISEAVIVPRLISPQIRFAAPSLTLAAQNPIAAAFGFTERFKVPSRENSNCVGFDVCWMNGGSENSILSASKWSIATSLTASSVQINPLDLKLSGSTISNAIVPRGLGGSQPEVTDLLISDFVNVSLSAGQIIEVRSNLASGANHTYNKSMRGTGDYYILSAGNFQEMYSCENTGVVGATGNCINGNPSVTCVIGGWLYGICFVRFYFELGTTSVLMVGDSVVQGIAGVSGEDGYGNISPLSIAAQIDPRISPLVFAHGNYFSSGSHEAQINLIKTLKPSISLIWAWSPNDNITNIETSINKAILVAQKAVENNSIPAICTPIPWGYSGSDLVKFKSAVSRVRDMCKYNPNLLLVDVCLYLEDPNNPGNIKAEYKGTATNGQEKHPGPFGKLRLAQCIVDSLSPILF